MCNGAAAAKLSHAEKRAQPARLLGERVGWERQVREWKPWGYEGGEGVTLFQGDSK